MKKQWEFSDYMVLIIIILLIAAGLFSCVRAAEKGEQERIEEAYSEGYDAGYYDGENGLPYNEDR